MVRPSRPALFLDRDGVIIHDAGYLRDAAQVRLLPGAAEMIRKAREAGWWVIVVTNQSGVGRGWITLDDYKAVSARMLELLEAKEAFVDRIFFAPFYKTADQSPYAENEYQFQSHAVPQEGAWNDQFRKPNPGMLLRAAEHLGVDLQASVMVGDRVTDMAAAHNAGLSRFYFLQSEIFEQETQDLSVWLSRLTRLKNGEFAYETIDHLMNVATPRRTP